MSSNRSNAVCVDHARANTSPNTPTCMTPVHLVLYVFSHALLIVGVDALSVDAVAGAHPVRATAARPSDQSTVRANAERMVTWAQEARLPDGRPSLPHAFHDSVLVDSDRSAVELRVRRPNSPRRDPERKRCACNRGDARGVPRGAFRLWW